MTRCGFRAKRADIVGRASGRFVKTRGGRHVGFEEIVRRGRGRARCGTAHAWGRARRCSGAIRGAAGPGRRLLPAGRAARAGIASRLDPRGRRAAARGRPDADRAQAGIPHLRAGRHSCAAREHHRRSGDDRPRPSIRVRTRRREPAGAPFAAGPHHYRAQRGRQSQALDRRRDRLRPVPGRPDHFCDHAPPSTNTRRRGPEAAQHNAFPAERSNQGRSATADRPRLPARRGCRRPVRARDAERHTRLPEVGAARPYGDARHPDRVAPPDRFAPSTRSAGAGAESAPRSSSTARSRS